MKNTIESPVRCVDIGGWLDTWFANHGQILNLSVLSRPFGKQGAFRGVEVSIEDNPEHNDLIDIRADDPNFDCLIKTDLLANGKFDHHNLLLAVLYLIQKKKAVKNGLKIRISSPIEPGASMGTSASVAVSLIKVALSGTMTDKEIAMMAWQAETEVMEGQSGTQDQFSASFLHPVKFIEVTDFPNTTCNQVKVKNSTLKKLERGLVTIFYGRHDSSSTHKKVICQLEKTGPEANELKPFRPLAAIAQKALLANDLKSFGQTMIANTNAQRQLCEGLVSKKAEDIIELARANKALGWKINGAGGAGGSITLLFPSREIAVEFYLHCSAICSPEYGYVYYEHQLI